VRFCNFLRKNYLRFLRVACRIFYFQNAEFITSLKNFMLGQFAVQGL